MPCKGKFFPGRGFSSGAIFAKKWGLEMFWGKCLKIIDLLTMSSLCQCFCVAKKANTFIPRGVKVLGRISICILMKISVVWLSNSCFVPFM